MSELDALWEEWSEWMSKGQVYLDIFLMESDQRRWEELVKTVTTNPNVEEPWAALNWFGEAHTSWMLVRLRRLQGTHAKDVSLEKVLLGIRQFSECVTRPRFMNTVNSRLAALWKDPIDPRRISTLKHADDFFSELAGGPAEQCVSYEVITEDYNSLEAILKNIKPYTDKRIAHTSTVQVQPVGPDEVAFAIHEAFRIWHRYTYLLTGDSPAEEFATDNTNWHVPFRSAWMPLKNEGNTNTY